MSELQQRLNFLLEIDQLKSVYRQALIKSDDNRRENSAEHSWHIALMAHVLAPYAPAEVNLERVLVMLLLHDLVEIDAGDTFAFANEQLLQGQHAKELQALERILGLLPDTQAQLYRQLWLEFEAQQSLDACYAKAMDCLLPLLQNVHNQGGSWRNHQVKRSQVLTRNRHLQQVAPPLWQYVVQQVDLATAAGWLTAD